MRNRLPLFLVKLFYYEYWPFWLFFLPLVPYWMYLAARHRSLTFFTLANPAIPHGGVFGESKSDILKKINSEYLPRSIYCESGVAFTDVLIQLSNQSMEFPLVAKPDVGERGTQVEKLADERDLEDYLLSAEAEFIIQEFIDYPIELGVLYFRTPLSGESGITSIVKKEFLTVVGDGESTILQLIEKSERAKLQLPLLKDKWGGKLNTVLELDKAFLLQPIGNHCLGTKFLSANDIIDDKLVKVFDQISNGIDGFHYGRFDLKVKSFDALEKGEGILIMELNGVTSEPGHIYDPKLNIFKAYRDTIVSLNKLSKVCFENKSLGFKETSSKDFVKLIRHHFNEEAMKETKEVTAV